MILKLFLTLFAVVIAFVIFVSMQPDDFKVARSVRINASPETVFSFLDDLRKFQEFSPWAKIDPAARIVFEGPERGVGAISAWSSADNKVGEGRMTVIESIPNQKVAYRLDFIKPFNATNAAEFALVPSAGAIQVTWSMSGSRNFLFKAVGVFIDCDKMVGGDFEKGLQSLKSLAERQPAIPTEKPSIAPAW